jgi:peptidoglycan/xylan/chitin deacetylase (PgdA/CDA1 family)
MIIQLGIYEPVRRSMITNNMGWKILCEQEKVPFAVTSRPDCPIMVFEGDTPEWFAQFIDDGGIGIVTDCYPDLLPFETEYVGDTSIEYVDLRELGGSLTRIQSIVRLYRGDGYGKINVHEKRLSKIDITQDEFPVFLYEGYGKGGCFFTGMPISRLVTALGDTLRPTASFSNFTERVVSIDKHYLLRAMREIVIKAFHKRDLPYVQLDYYPGDYQSALAFRIDLDGIFGENLINISKSAIENGFRLTIFANKSLCKDEEEFIRRIDREHEIGNHADIHNLYTDYDSNFRNIQECQNWLNTLGIKNNKLFSAPRGMWNYSLHKALDDLGYLYTSDFGAGINGFPFFPYISGVKSGTLQIPINPFSAERAAIWRKEEENKEINADYIAEFFIKIIQENYKQGYPIILYSHPEKFGTMANCVFRKISQKIKNMNIWRTTLTHFADWWFRRDKINYCVEYDDSTNRTMIKGDIDGDVRVKEI